MARYIDADKTLDLMWNALYKYEDEDEEKNGLSTTRLDVQSGFEIAHKVVVDALAEDVAPVVHAHWYKKHKDSPFYYCSNCDGTSANIVEWAQKYCYHCGAIMDEKEG